MRVGIAADHGGFTLKGQVAESLRGSGFEVVDFGYGGKIAAGRVITYQQD